MSINIGLSGLRATSDQINTISHNISNVGTVGFKSSRTEFQDVYAPQFGGGEVGGVEVSNVRQSFASGATTSTGRNSDLAINGEGFFMVQQNGQRMYTRNGMFNLDADGYLVTSDGFRLQGYGVSETGSIQNGALADLQISTADMAAKVTTKVSLGVNLDAGAAVIEPKQKKFAPDDPSTFTCSASTTVYDSLGGEHEITQYFVKTGENTWSVHYVADGQELKEEPTELKFDENGNLIEPEDPISVTLKPTNGSADMTIQMDVSEFTQFGSDFSINESKQDGYAPGKLAGWYFDADGSVYARYSNGKTQLQGQLVLARFSNQEGLQQAGGTRWTESFSSGNALLGQPGTGQFGVLRVGAYESSNVDLTEEMVSLMSAQSNYQANAKTIQASQEMVQILFQNL